MIGFLYLFIDANTREASVPMTCEPAKEVTITKHKQVRNNGEYNT